MKGIFFKEEPKEENQEIIEQPEESTEQVIEEGQLDKGQPTGQVCEHCQKDIYTNEVTRTVANKILHKRCAKQLRKMAKQMLWG